MIDKGKYGTRQYKGRWYIVEMWEIARGIINIHDVARHKNRERVKMIYDGILAGQYETESDLYSDIDNLLERSPFVDDFEDYAGTFTTSCSNKKIPPNWSYIVETWC